METVCGWKMHGRKRIKLEKHTCDRFIQAFGRDRGVEGARRGEIGSALNLYILYKK